jgi:malate/lactate dehydrogenase
MSLLVPPRRESGRVDGESGERRFRATRRHEARAQPPAIVLDQTVVLHQQLGRRTAATADDVVAAANAAAEAAAAAAAKEAFDAVVHCASALVSDVSVGEDDELMGGKGPAHHFALEPHQPRPAHLP